jgi:hypothetical protein
MSIEERCPSCGTPPHLPHLRNCKIMRRPGMPLHNQPTVRMMDLAFQLQRELEYAEVVDPGTLTFADCQKLIDRLLTEKREREDLEP